jgi:hypothetical protein
VNSQLEDHAAVHYFKRYFLVDDSSFVIGGYLEIYGGALNAHWWNPVHSCAHQLHRYTSWERNFRIFHTTKSQKIMQNWEVMQCFKKLIPTFFFLYRKPFAKV